MASPPPDPDSLFARVDLKRDALPPFEMKTAPPEPGMALLPLSRVPAILSSPPLLTKMAPPLPWPLRVLPWPLAVLLMRRLLRMSRMPPRIAPPTPVSPPTRPSRNVTAFSVREPSKIRSMRLASIVA
jgi:hypothetical protein